MESLTTSIPSLSKGCHDELNAQLQALDARLKQTERSVNTLAKGVASVASGSYSPTFDAVGAAFKTMGTLPANLFAAAYQDVIAQVEQLDPLQFMTSLVLQAAMRALGSLTVPLDLINNITDGLNHQYNYYLGIISDPASLPANIAAAQAAIADIHLLFDTMSGFMAATNNISQCKSSALIIR